MRKSFSFQNTQLHINSDTFTKWKYLEKLFLARLMTDEIINACIFMTLHLPRQDSVVQIKEKILWYDLEMLYISNKQLSRIDDSYINIAL